MLIVTPLKFQCNAQSISDTYGMGLGPKSPQLTSVFVSCLVGDSYVATWCGKRYLFRELFTQESGIRGSILY